MKMKRFLLCLLTCVFAAAPAIAEETYSFTVKGVVKSLPGQGAAQNEILVKHEEIPDYRDSSGKVVGMMAMTMPFYLADSTSLAGIAVGDSVEMVVEQRLEPKYSEKVVSIAKMER